jgi:hypothetical protein
MLLGTNETIERNTIVRVDTASPRTQREHLLDSTTAHTMLAIIKFRLQIIAFETQTLLFMSPTKVYPILLTQSINPFSPLDKVGINEPAYFARTMLSESAGSVKDNFPIRSQSSTCISRILAHVHMSSEIHA